jgi:hypothetical protein
MMQKDVALYYYVKTCLKNLPKKCHFQTIFNPFMSPLSNEFFLQCFKNVFESYILIKFIPNHSTCFHNILKILLCKHIK